MKLLLVVFTLITSAVAQTTNQGQIGKGTQDNHLATRTLPHRTGTGSPVARDACTVVGETFFQTDATAGSNLFGCTTTGTPGTWTLQGSGGVGTVTSSGTPLVHQVAVWSTATNAIGMTVGTDGQVFLGHTGADPGFGVLTAAMLPAVPLPTPSGAFTVSLPSGYGKCTTTCTVTVPAPTAAGQQFCVWNGVGVSTAITLSGISGVQYGKTDMSAYGTANTAATATAAAGNKICMVAPDTTHWDVLSYAGTWTM